MNVGIGSSISAMACGWAAPAPLPTPEVIHARAYARTFHSYMPFESMFRFRLKASITCKLASDDEPTCMRHTCASTTGMPYACSCILTESLDCTRVAVTVSTTLPCLATTSTAAPLCTHDGARCRSAESRTFGQGFRSVAHREDWSACTTPS